MKELEEMLGEESKARRRFLEKAGKLSAAAPAVALLLAAGSKPAEAQSYAPVTTTPPPGT